MQFCALCIVSFELKTQRASNLKNFSMVVGIYSVYSCVCIHLHVRLYNYKKSGNLGMLLPITGCLDLNIYGFACVIYMNGLLFPSLDVRISD